MSTDSGILTPAESEVFEKTVLVRHELQEQFEDLEHQEQTASLSMWVFLANELLLFGALFMCLGVYRYCYVEASSAASHKLNWITGSVNALVLIVSSLFMNLALHTVKSGGSRRRLALFLLAAALMGVCFLCIKGLEYYTDWRDSIIPGWKFKESDWIDKEHLRPEQVQYVKLWFVFYWIMTGLHAVHLTIGIVMVLVLVIMARRGFFSPLYHSPVEVVSLYWHFVDMVWIVLLPMLYLQGTHTMSDFYF
jgi:cytochrome c oxidase subunit 3